MDERIVVAGREGPAPAPGRPWLRAAASVALALLAVVALTRTPSNELHEAAGMDEASDALAAAEAVPTTLPPTLSERIEGWQWVLAVTTSTGVTAWNAAAAGPEGVRAPPGEIAADSSGRWLSIVTGPPVRGLWVGGPSDIAEIEERITGAVWHPFEPGRIAWVEASGDRTVLVVVDLDFPESDRTELAEVPEGAVPVWWNAAGIALQVEGAVLVVDPRGTITFADDGRLAPGGPAWAVVERGGELVLVNPLLRRLGAAPWDAGCGPPATEPWSGSLAAVVCQVDGSTELQVWRFAGTLATQVFTRRGFDPGVRPAWTPGGRFVLAAGRDGTTVLVIDLTSREVHNLEIGGRITGLAIGR